MDGIAEETEELAREPRVFTSSEKSLLIKLRREGRSNAEIAQKLGCTTATLLWFIRQGRFGNVPKRQGQHRGRKHTPPDCEKSQRLFGTTSWQDRQKQIRDGWDEAEARRRANGELPNVGDPYARFKRK